MHFFAQQGLFPTAAHAAARHSRRGKPATGEPCAGEPQARLEGGEGDLPDPYHLRLVRGASAFLRQHLLYAHGGPGGRWLTILMNCIYLAISAVAFTAWVRETWPDRPEFVAIDGKTSAAATTAPPAKRRFNRSPPSPPPAA